MIEYNPSDLRLSVSKAKTFSDCRKKFNFVYNLKFPRKEFEYHTFGKLVHRILETFHQDIIDGNTSSYNVLMKKHFDLALSEYKDKLTKEMKTESYEMCKSYLDLMKEHHYNVIACEQDFKFKVAEDIVVSGQIDRVEIDKDNVLHVGDYKTTKNAKYLKNDFFQLLTYAYALFLNDTSITKIRTSYILLRHKFEFVTKEFNVDEIITVGEKFIEYGKKIRNEKDFPANPTKLCEYCEYSQFCEEGKLLIAKNKQFNFKFGESSW
jgi:RecB family exonuclease